MGEDERIHAAEGEAQAAGRPAGRYEPGGGRLRMKKKVAKSAWNVAKDKASMQMNVEKVQVYEEAFAKMQAATGISDIDELVENFINAEDQNFSLFTYANELSGDIEKHEAEIADLKSQLEFL